MYAFVPLWKQGRKSIREVPSTVKSKKSDETDLLKYVLKAKKDKVLALLKKKVWHCLFHFYVIL
jgi:hypothetical protein